MCYIAYINTHLNINEKISSIGGGGPHVKLDLKT